MDKSEINKYLNYLTEIGIFLTELKNRYLPELTNIKTKEVVENYLNNFSFSSPERSIEDLKLNNTKKNDIFWKTKTELENMNINIPGVSINSKPRKDGRFQGYIADKKNRTYVYGKTMEEVATKIKNYLRYGLPKKKKTLSTINGVPISFTSFALYYFENFRKKKVAEKTYYSDLNRFNRYLQPYFKETPIKRISPKECQTLIDSIEETGKGKTADEIYSLLSVIFKMAIKHNIITNNPIEIVFHIQHERKHGKALTKQEEISFKTTLIGSSLLQPFMILLYTGLRPNELKTVKIDGNFIIAVNSKRKHKRIEYKRIPISKMLAPYLKGVDVPNLSSADYLSRKIREILPNHILYDLRTTFYNRCKECGISEEARNYFMGHSLGAIGNAYTNLSDEYLIKEMNKFIY